EDGPARVEHRAVHLPRLVLEDAQVDHLVRQVVRVLVPVLAPDAEQDEEAGPDGGHTLPVHGDRRLRDPLDDGSHRAQGRALSSPGAGGSGAGVSSAGAGETPPQIGRFRVLDLVGEGAMGVVFRGRDESLDRDVALKVMRAQAAAEEDRERFLREARAVARLQHPNIVTVYELGEHEGSPFIAMELLEGVDLQRAIEGGLRPSRRVTLPVVLQLLAGLGHAHDNGIVHRDVKPSNLFLPRGRPAKITDFGVARLGGGTATSSVMVGTPNYMSPEQVQARPLDGRSDLFSAGLILFELVTGEKAYHGDSAVS